MLGLGDSLPALKLQDNEGKEVDVSALAGEKGVVFFLYPKVSNPAIGLFTPRPIARRVQADSVGRHPGMYHPSMWIPRHLPRYRYAGVRSVRVVEGQACSTAKGE